MFLDQLKPGTAAQIVAVDWASLPVGDARRLRALGLDEGAQVTLAHKGPFGLSDPLAVTVDRTMIALRRVHAAAMTVEQA